MSDFFVRIHGSPEITRTVLCYGIGMSITAIATPISRALTKSRPREHDGRREASALSTGSRSPTSFPELN
jgi:hypothetical protein